MAVTALNTNDKNKDALNSSLILGDSSSAVFLMQFDTDFFKDVF